MILIIIIVIIVVYLLKTRTNRFISRFLTNIGKPRNYETFPKIDNKIPIYIFIHLCNYGENWKSIISDQINQIIDSGLYDICNQIFYGCSCDTCDEVLQNFFINYKKMKKLSSQGTNVHENMTINEIIKFSKDNKCYILYLHSKGVTGKSNNQTYWRDFMMNYLIKMWRVCVNLLNNGYYTVGVNYQKFGPHYSGNFWWADSEYIKKLDYITDLSNRYMAEYKLLEIAEKNKHINISSEFWISIINRFKTGLYSDIGFNHDKDYEEHEYNMNNPDSLPIYIF